MPRRTRTPLTPLLLPLLAAAVFACGPTWMETEPESESEPPLLSVDLTLETHTVGRRAADCEETPDGCGRISLTWTEITDAPAGVARDALNRWAHMALLDPPLGEDAGESPDALADDFIAQYERFRRDDPGSPGGWFVERTVEIVHRDDHVVSFRDVESSFTGGAHPNRTETWRTLYLTTGQPLTLDDLLLTGGHEELRRIAETRFRQVRGLEPDEDLREAGFWFGAHGSSGDEGEITFELSHDFAVTGDGLRFHYNPYQIAPYSVGPTTVDIPRSQLDDVVQWPGGR